MATAARTAPPPILWQGDVSLQNKERRSAGAGGDVTMNLAGLQTIGGKVKRAIPKRARTQHGPARLFHNLPVEAAERDVEARIGERPFQKQGAILATSEMADELTQVQLQLDDDTPLDVPLEKQRQTQPRQRQRDQDGRGAGRQQPQPERAVLHGEAGLGMT